MAYIWVLEPLRGMCWCHMTQFNVGWYGWYKLTPRGASWLRIWWLCHLSFMSFVFSTAATHNAIWFWVEHNKTCQWAHNWVHCIQWQERLKSALVKSSAKHRPKEGSLYCGLGTSMWPSMIWKNKWPKNSAMVNNLGPNIVDSKYKKFGVSENTDNLIW